MKNSQPPISSLLGGRSRPQDLLSTSAHGVEGLLHTPKYFGIVKELLRVEGGGHRDIVEGILAKVQIKGMEEGTMYAPLGESSSATGDTNEQIAESILNRIIKSHRATYEGLSKIPLDKWSQEHISIARQIISADCVRKYGKPARFVKNEELYSRFIKILSHFKQLERLTDESLSLSLPLERVRVKPINPATGKTVRNTGLSVRRVLNWMTGGMLGSK